MPSTLLFLDGMFFNEYLDENKLIKNYIDKFTQETAISESDDSECEGMPVEVPTNLPAKEKIEISQLTNSKKDKPITQQVDDHKSEDKHSSSSKNGSERSETSNNNCSSDDSDPGDSYNLKMNENKADSDFFKNFEEKKMRNTSAKIDEHKSIFTKDFDASSMPRNSSSITKLNTVSIDMINLINYYLPINQRMYKVNNTTIDVTLANTITNAIRNYANDGKSMKSTLTKGDSFSQQELEVIKKEIECIRQKKGPKHNPLKDVYLLFSTRTAQSLQSAMDANN